MEELVSCRESLVREDEREVLRVLMTMMLVLSFVFLFLRTSANLRSCWLMLLEGEKKREN